MLTTYISYKYLPHQTVKLEEMEKKAGNAEGEVSGLRLAWKVNNDVDLVVVDIIVLALLLLLFLLLLWLSGHYCYCCPLRIIAQPFGGNFDSFSATSALRKPDPINLFLLFTDFNLILIILFL